MTELTHRDLDRLAEQHRAGAMLFGSDEHDAFIEAAIQYMPALIEAARQVVPGDLLAEIHIPGFCPRGTLNSRGHWTIAHRRVKREREVVGLALLAGAPQLRNKGALVGRVVVTQHAVRLLDSDNCTGALKGTRDAVAKWLGVNDGDPSISWGTGQRKVKRAEVAVVIRVEASR